MQVYTRKSSCAPPRGTPWVTPSTEGAKADKWRYNQSDLQPKGRLTPTEKPPRPQGRGWRRANHSIL